jgi:effector-binding domain-containing protein
MKKLLIGLLIFLILFLGCIYILIPARITVTSITTVSASINSTQRYLSDKPDRIKWWPGNDNVSKADLESNISFYRGYNFKIPHHLSNSTIVLITKDSNDINSSIIFIKLTIDTTLIQWQYNFQTSINPIKRIRVYAEARDLKNTIDDISKDFKSYMDKPENVYNLRIENKKVKDTLLLSTKKIFSTKPRIEDVYDMIAKLKDYIQNNGVKETNFPMLNVRETETKFEAMVAIPIDKRVKETDNYLIKRMVPGNILVTEIKGGLKTVEKAYKNFDYYISDYNFSMPAIPFELLITDRTKEADTSKWITRIYYPVR